MASVLIVDDDAGFAEELAATVTALGHRAVWAAGARAAGEATGRGDHDIVFLDLRLGDGSGLELLRAWRRDLVLGPVPIVILTAYASADNTIEAMKLGAFDHLTKPVGRDQIAEVLDRALARPPHRRFLPSTEATADDILIGASPVMRQLQKAIGLAAATEATVLITGETGTGKEMVARALHTHGARAGKPFVAVNCAAIPADLLESELFGHVRGAFTGAVAPRLGRFREADGGTLVLDEVGDMSLAMQAKLLRVLQDRLVTPVGSGETHRVDVRIVGATNRDLIAMVKVGGFRADLFYRLNVMPLHVPALRERGSDILLLAEHFLARAAAPTPPKKLAAAAAKALLEYPWPGNVRELANLMGRLHATVRRPVIDHGDLSLLPAEADADLPTGWLDLDLLTAVARLEKALIVRALSLAGGNRAEAARRLNIRRQLLYAKMREHGIAD